MSYSSKGILACPLAVAVAALVVLTAAMPSAALARPLDPADVLPPLDASTTPQAVAAPIETVRIAYPPDGGRPAIDPVFVGAAASGFMVLVSDVPFAVDGAKVALLADGAALRETEIAGSAVVSFEDVPVLPSNDYGLRVVSAEGATLHEATGLRFWTEDAALASKGLLELIAAADPTRASASGCNHISQATRTIYTGGTYNVGNGDFSTDYRDLIGGSWKSNWNYGSNCHSTRYSADYFMAFGIRGQNQMGGPGYYSYEYAVNERGAKGPGSLSYFQHGHTIVTMKPRAFMVTPTGVTASVVDADAEGRPAQSCTSTFILRAPLVFVKNIWVGIADLFIPDYICSNNWLTITSAASGAGGRGNEFSLNSNGEYLSGAGWITTRYDSRGEFSMKAEGDFYIDARMGGAYDTETGILYSCGSPCDTVSQYWEYWQLSRQAKVV